SACYPYPTRRFGVVTAVKLLEKMARPRGVEPLTPRSVVWCSIQLSYGRLCHAAAGMPAARAATITPALRLWQGHPGTSPGQGNPGKPHRDGLTIAADPLRWDRIGGLAREKTRDGRYGDNERAAAGHRAAGGHGGSG